MVSPAIINLIIVLVTMQASKQIDFNDERVLWTVRAAYVASNLIIAAIYFYCKLQIDSKKDMTTLKYVEPPSATSGTEEPKLVVTTVRDYDLQAIRAAFKGQLMGLVMMGFMHLYMRYTNPLIIQAILPLKTALESTIVKLHFFGQKDVGDLKRPWKTGGGGGLLAAIGGQGAGQNEIKTDKASIEAAEKKLRGGVKDE